MYGKKKKIDKFKNKGEENFILYLGKVSEDLPQSRADNLTLMTLYMYIYVYIIWLHV